MSDYPEFHHSLNKIKLKIELLPYQESKYFLKNLIPFLLDVWNFLKNMNDQDSVIVNIKSVSLEIFSKVIWDNELIDAYVQVLDL